MFFHIFLFELRYWLRQPIVYIFLLINALLVFGATSSDDITIGGSIGNVHKNAPYVVEFYFANLSLICLLMITAFFNSAAARDFSEKTSQIFFSTPLKKRDYLLGRFAGALVISIIPFLGVSLGSILGSMMPWLDADRVGPIFWTAHLEGLAVFVLPNMLFAGSVVFSIAALTRSTMLSFIGTIGLLVGYIVSLNLIGDMENEFLGAMLDPFGFRTFIVATKYWTVDDRNTMSMGMEGLLLLNRLVWMAVGAVVFVFTYFKFSFSDTARPGKQKNAEKQVVAEHARQVPETVKPGFGTFWSLRQLVSQLKIEGISIVKNVAFLVIVIFGIINLSSSLAYATSMGYGLTVFPVTWNIVDTIKGSFYLFIVAFITFYSGAIVWKERESKVNDIYDALPYPDWLPVVSKTLALAAAVLLLLLTGCTIGIATQLLNGFTDIRPEVYFTELFLDDGLTFLNLIVLSVFLHSVVNNRYLGYFLFVVVLIANSFVWPALDIQSNLVIFNSTPSLTYSDMNAFGPFLLPVLSFSAYWTLAGLILLVGALLYWVRGRENDFRIRTRLALERLKRVRPLLMALFVLWFSCGAWLFYNTKVINTYQTSDQSERMQVNYEKMYKQYEMRPQPRTISLDYHIELYPGRRALEVSCRQVMMNRHKTPIDTLFFTLSPTYSAVFDLPGSQLLLMDTVQKFAMYRLDKALMPGDSLEMNLSMKYYPRGIENEVTVTAVVDNGTFFNNADILPQTGYQSAYELSDKNKRKKYNLPLRVRMPDLSDDSVKRMNTYLSNNSDWVRVRSVFGTSGDQIAIAPGSLRRQWTENGRNYFEYELDHPSANFYSFMSARYEVRKKMHKGISLEVYYDSRHAYNVDKMLMSMEKSIDYYSTHFGPYRHKQARIIEFPRYASFAQAFPGTMPYSEGIGFIANLEDPEDIDMVTYIVAHEMGHQWWAHQVAGADMQGATLLSETLAQYSALMVMEQMYGKDQMHKFLKYEMDEYLSTRGSEADKECPLQEVENQGYIHYQKGSVVMYYLKEMTGEPGVNAALKNLVDSFAYHEPPYPNARELVNRLEAQTPDSLRYLIDDLFRKITLFDNRTLDANTVETDGGYKTTLKVQSAKMYADSLGRETPAVLNDWIEVGVFAEPEKGKKYGRALGMKRVRISEKENTFTFFTAEKPSQAGIDPYYYVVDRVPDDNIKKVTEKTDDE
ncbi:MAG: hypothetical protein RJA20_1689 [Bacteroidota bacterium]|jgi:ABC-2 type transport system permease protein